MKPEEKRRLDRYERAALAAVNEALDLLGCAPVERLAPGVPGSLSSCPVAVTVRGCDRDLQVEVENGWIRVASEELELEFQVRLCEDGGQFIRRVDAGGYGDLIAA